MTTGTIEGGNTVNTVPADCRFIFSVRITDSAVADEVESTVNAYIEDTVQPAMRAEYPEATVELVSTVRMPVFNVSEEADFTASFRALCDEGEIRKEGGGTETGFFKEHLGIPIVVFGPDTVKAAHLPNEYVQVCMMNRCRDLMVELAKRCTTVA